MESGIYILVLTHTSAEICIGSLGIRTFPAGYLAYVGSALGPGGLARVSRHIRFSMTRDRPPRWHIDYLLRDERFRLVRVYCVYTRERLECSLAQEMVLPVIPGFGSSDCRCAGHLFSSPVDPEPPILVAFRSLGMRYTIHHLN
jgi:Uri superfamily endonuclease